MRCTRRQWFASAAAVAARAAGQEYRPLLGAQIYVWMQQFDRQGKTIAQGVEEALPAIARAGYKRVELDRSFLGPEAGPRTRALLRQCGLELPVVYNGGPMHEPAAAEVTVAETLRVAGLGRAAGAKAVNCNPAPIRERKTDAQLETQAKYLNELGERLRDRGMTLLVHQHAPEMRENAREWRHELRNTDPKLVSFCLDLDWVKRGGQDPMELLQEAGPRVASLHLRSARQGVWMEEFADGDIDYRAVAAYLKRTRYRGWMFVELAYEKKTEITRPLEEDLRRSREFAEKIFLAG
jgi:inosose dehydratase